MHKKNELAPIVLFVYNRLEHTKQTIKALQKNTLATESELYIYSDGPKNNEVAVTVDKIRKYLKSIDGFKNVFIVERERNFGLAASIIDGVTSVINEYGKVIVLEDDLITSKYFLKFMNDALMVYDDVENIFSITGFSFSTKFMKFPEEYKEDIYLNIRPMSWSWATWIDRWKDVDWEVKNFQEFIKDPKQIKEFNRGGTDLTRMLRNQMNGKLDSWYIRWTFNAFRRNKLTIYPRVSYVNNIGHDASGVHCNEDTDNIYSHNELNNVEVNTFNRHIRLNNEIVKSFNRGFDTNYFKILKRKIKSFSLLNMFRIQK